MVSSGTGPGGGRGGGFFPTEGADGFAGTALLAPCGARAVLVVLEELPWEAATATVNRLTLALVPCGADGGTGFTRFASGNCFGITGPRPGSPVSGLEPGRVDSLDTDSGEPALAKIGFDATGIEETDCC